MALVVVVVVMVPCGEVVVMMVVEGWCGGMVVEGWCGRMVMMMMVLEGWCDGVGDDGVTTKRSTHCNCYSTSNSPCVTQQKSASWSWLQKI